MKILHIISSSGLYGAEAVILNLSRTLNKAAHSSVLGVFSNSSNPNLQLYDAATREGIESHLVPCSRQLDRTVLASIRALVARTGAEVVHAHGYNADIYTYLAMRKSGTPLVSTCHTWYDNDLAVSLYGAADRFVLRRFAAVAAVSAEVRQRLLTSGVCDRKIYMVKNGIDLQPFEAAVPSLRGGLSLAPDALIVGLVARLAPEKGVDIFLRAAARVIVHSPTTRFIIAGDGPDRDLLESLIGELNLRDHVLMLGRCSDMPSIYASFDILVSASRQEGLPVALLEGMASGSAIIATAVGEVPSIILHDRTGLLISPEDPDLLTDSILALLQSEPRRKRLGAAARQLAKQEFSSGRMSADYLEIYEQLAAAGKERTAGLEWRGPLPGKSK